MSCDRVSKASFHFVGLGSHLNFSVALADHFGGICRHRPGDVGGFEQPLLIYGEPAQVTEVLDIEVRSERADELGRLAERVGETERAGPAGPPKT